MTTADRRSTSGADGSPRRFLRLGSLTLELVLPVERYGTDVAYIFGTTLAEPGWRPEGGVDVEVVFREPPFRHREPPAAVPDDGMVLEHDSVHPRIDTEALSTRLRLDRDPVEVRIDILQPDMAHFDLCVHLAVVFHKLLFFLDRIVLHGAGVRFEDGIALFLGDKGAGKSTIALRLARAGGTVLGEDHLVLHRSDDGFVVSGCDERSRLTRKTEEHFFDEPLDAEPRDFAGTMKKEVAAGMLFESRPYVDQPPDLLFFPRVGRKVELTRLPGRAALLELMRQTGKLQRFVDPEDRRRFLDFLADFVPTVRAYHLELSPDLAELDRLVELVRELASDASGREVRS